MSFSRFIQGPLTQHLCQMPTAGEPTICPGIQTCGQTCFLTCGGPTHCGGIHTCGFSCFPTCGIACQIQDVVAMVTAGGPTQCGGIHTCAQGCPPAGGGKPRRKRAAKKPKP